MSYNFLFKIVVIGDHNCGKSCVLLRFAENSFRHDHISTLGVDFKLKTIKIGRDKIRLELWDTAGMERYRTIYNSYYHSAHGVMVVYDITEENSFEHLKNYWLPEIQITERLLSVASTRTDRSNIEKRQKIRPISARRGDRQQTVRKHAPQNATVMLIGNKADLSGERRVSFADAEQFASETGVSLYEVSAKTGINVEEAFAELATTMRQRVKSAAASLLHSEDSEPDLSSAFHVDGTGGKVKPSSWSNCCSSAPPPAFV